MTTTQSPGIQMSKERKKKTPANQQIKKGENAAITARKSLNLTARYDKYISISTTLFESNISFKSSNEHKIQL